MKFATAWWGVQILAETKKDKEILEYLLKELPSKTNAAYEDGEVYEITKSNCDDFWGFTKEEVENSKMCIEFMR